jgi:hypothetical protein
MLEHAIITREAVIEPRRKRGRNVRFAQISRCRSLDRLDPQSAVD